MNYNKWTVQAYITFHNAPIREIKLVKEKCIAIFQTMHDESPSIKLWTRCEFIHYSSPEPSVLGSIAVFRIYNANKKENIDFVEHQIKKLKDVYPHIADITCSRIRTG